MTLILVRHGETPLNVARVLQPVDTPLGERGHAQAVAVARRLVAERPAAILASDLLRAWQTAQAIAAACGLVPRPSALLHERNFGALRGRPYDSLGFDPLASGEAPPGGESAAEFEARVDQALQQAVRWRAALPGPLVVVSHGLLIRALLERHAVVDAGAQLPEKIENTAVTIVDAAAPHRVRLLACSRHLDGIGLGGSRSLSGG